MSNDEDIVMRLKMEAEQAISATKAFGAEVGQMAAGAKDAIGKADASAQGMGASLSGMSGPLKSVGTGLLAAFGIGSITSAASALLDFTGNLTDLSAKTGIGTSELQKLKFAAEQNGGSLEGVTGAIGKMGKALIDGDEGTVGAMKRLGLSVDDVRKMDPATAFATIGDAIAEIPNPMERSTAAMDIFGKSGAELLPMMTGNLSETMRAADALGIVMDESTIAAGDNLGDTLGALQSVGMALIGKVLGPMLPALNMAASALLSAGDVVVWLQTGFDALARVTLIAIKTMVDGALAVGDFASKIPGLSKVLGDDSTAMHGLKDASTFLGGAIDGLEKTTDTATVKTKQFIPPTADLTDKQTAAAKAAEAHQKAIQGLVDKLAGKGAIQAAKDMVDALKDLPPIQRLTKDHQVEVAKAMEEAILVYKAAGIAIPKEFRLIALEARGWSKTMTEEVAAEMKATADALAAPFKNFKLPIGPMKLQARQLQIEMAGALVPRPEDVEQQFSRVRDPITGHVTTFYKGVSLEASTSMLTGMGSMLSEKMGPTIIGALQGGGDVAASVGSLIGGKLGANLVSEAGSWITGTFGKTFGGAINSIIPGLGAMLGPLATAVVGFFKNLFGTAGRDAVKDFATSMGGFDELHVKLGALGAAGEDLWKKLTQGVGRNNPEQAKAVIAEITTALEDQKAKVDDLTAAHNTELTALITASGTWRSLPDDMVPYIDKLVEAGLLTKDNATQLQLFGRQGGGDFKQLKSDAEAFGVSLSALGPQFQQAELDAEAKKIIGFIEEATARGGDFGGILEGLKDEISGVVQHSLKFGTEIPANMKPWVEELARSGRLLDENGNKIEDVSALTFGETIKAGLDDVVSKLQEMIDLLAKGLPGAVGTVESSLAKNKGAWTDWRNHARTALEDVQDEVDAVSFGHSPGGLKEIPLMLAKAVQATSSFARHALDEFGDVQSTVDDLGLFGMSPAFASGASDMLGGGGAGGGGGVTVVIQDGAIDASGSMFTDTQSMRRMASIVSDEIASRFKLTRKV